MKERSDEEAEALAEHQRWWIPQWAAVAEGFCPAHSIPLEPVTCAPGWAGGHCSPCRAYWGNDIASREITWSRDRQPWNHDQPVRPGWVLS